MILTDLNSEKMKINNNDMLIVFVLREGERMERGKA